MYSLIVAIYKVEQYLEQCIKSILAQTHQDFELILVDDGSPDLCGQICDTYAKNDQRIKVVHKENGGLVSARKAGLAVAQGEYVCFIDGDDFWSSDLLETYDKTLSAQRVDIVCTSYLEYYNDEHVVAAKQRIPNGIYDKQALKNEVYPYMLSVAPFFSFFVFPTVWSKCFKRSIAEKIYMDMVDHISLGEDVAVTYPALLEADSVCVIDYCGYMYRQNLSSMTRTRDANLYGKIKNLICYLKRIEQSKGWASGTQIDEYAVYLLMLAKNNEFKYSTTESYKIKKRNFNVYLKDPLFHAAMKNVKVRGIKNRFLLFCFKRCWSFPLYLYEAMTAKRRSHE